MWIGMLWAGLPVAITHVGGKFRHKLLEKSLSLIIFEAADRPNIKDWAWGLIWQHVPNLFRFMVNTLAREDYIHQFLLSELISRQMIFQLHEM